jgi:hypothetical protein
MLIPEVSWTLSLSNKPNWKPVCASSIVCQVGSDSSLLFLPTMLCLCSETPLWLYLLVLPSFIHIIHTVGRVFLGLLSDILNNPSTLLI